MAHEAPQTDGDAARGTDTNTKTPAKQEPRKKRRWLRRFFFAGFLLCALIGALVGFAPTIASTELARNQILSIVNGRLQGDIALTTMSLSWFGKCEAKGFKVSDPSGRDVLHVDAMNFDGGVWDAIGALSAFDQVNVDSPEVVLHVADDGSVSIADAFRLKNPSDTESDISFPDGVISVSNGSVKVVRADGRRYEVSDVNSKVDLKSSGGMDATLGMTLADGKKLTGEIEVRRLISAGELTPTEAEGRLRIRTEGDVDLQPIGRVALKNSTVEGRADLDIETEFKSGQVVSDLNARFAGLRAAGEGVAEIRPIDLQLTSKIIASKERLDGEVNLAGEAGTTQAKFSYGLSEKAVDVSLDEMLAAVLDGKPIKLPDFTLDAQGRVDLPSLAKAVPDLLKIRPGSEITAGRLALGNVSIKGGALPSAKAQLELADLSATVDGRTTRWEPITIDVDVLSDSGDGLRVQRAELKSGFGQVVATGTLSSLQAELAGDFEKLQQQFDQVFDIGSFELGGRFSANVSVSNPGGQRLAVESSLVADGVRYRDRHGGFQLNRLTLNQNSEVELKGHEKPKLVVNRADATIDDGMNISTSGWYDLQQESFHADVNVDQADLGLVGRLASSMGVDALGQYSGNLQLQSKLDKPSRQAEMHSEGRFLLRNGAVGRESLGSEVRGQWSGVALSADGEKLDVQLAKLESSLAKATVQAVQCNFGDDLILSGDVNAHADLSRCMPVVARMTKSKTVPNLSGQLTIKTLCKADAGGFTLTGDGAVDGFQMTTKDGSRVRDNLRFRYDTVLTHGDDKINVRQCQLTSRLLTADMKGDVSRYSTERELNLNGKYEASWDELTKVLHQLSPSTSKTVALQGKGAGRFKVMGPASRPNVETIPQELGGNMETGWGSATVFGVMMRKAVLNPVLKNGQIHLPVTKIRGAGGRVFLGGNVDLRSDPPRLIVPGELRVLEGIEVTPELGQQLLCRFVPIFGHMVSAEGFVNLDVKDIALPLGEEINRGGRGSGRMDLSKLKVQPGRFMALLLELGGLGYERRYAIQVGTLDFLIRDGRIYYDNFRMRFTPEYDLILSGSVGLDGTLDLVISFPMHPALLNRLAVRGPLSRYAEELKDVRVEIPCVGTRENPKLDFSRVDTKKLLRKVIGKGLVGDLLGGWGDRKKKKP
ncbi:MAG: hypothetical protein MI923_30520 [Phycisphaerales bacterium]|nr:hypothetical protein [Phycisphaerales bacterium]